MKNFNLKLNKRLAGYSATAVALTAVSTNVDAQVAYSGLKNIVVKNSVDSIDLDGDGIKDFRILHGTYSSVYKFAAINMLQSGNAWIGSSSFAYALTNGAYVSSSYHFTYANNSYNLGSAIFSNYYGYFPGSLNRFIGVKFMIGSDLHYGWIRVNVPTLVDSVTIVDWAYQTKPDYWLITGDTAAPVLSGIAVDNIGMDTAVFHVKSNHKGDLYFGIREASDPAPTLAELGAGTGFIIYNATYVVADSSYSFDLSGLSPNVAYKIYACAKDLSYDTSAVSSVSFATLDTIAPVLSGISVNNIKGSSATLSVSSDKNGTIYFAVKHAADPAPLANEIKAGTGFVAAGYLSDTASEIKHFNITGLSALTDYKVYVVAVNLAGYTSTVSDTSFSTPDAIVLSSTSVTDVQSTSAVVHFTCNKSGTAYYAVKTAASPAPSDTAIMAGKGFILSGNLPDTAAMPMYFSLTGLKSSTAYSVYLVAVDTSKNLSNVIRNNFFTLAPPVNINITEKDVKLYPNPASEALYITSPEIAEYTLIDMLGNTIQKGTLNAGKSEISIGGFEKGIYIVHLKFGNSIITKKIIIK